MSPLALLATVPVGSLATALLAQASAQPGAQTGVTVGSVWDFVLKGGILMIPIGICSLIALTVIVERAFSLRRRNVLPPGFLDGLRAALGPDRAGRQTALEYCRKDPSPLARVALVAVERVGERRELLEQHVAQAGERAVLGLRKYLRTLAVIVSVAPMLGLLGTVFGMIHAFQTVAASAEALGRTELLARGIYEALITTAAGLIVAIPALVGHHWAAARVDRLVVEMDALVVDFIETHAGRAGSVNASVPAPRSAAAHDVLPHDVLAAGELDHNDGRLAARPSAASAS
ncbi:MAG: MotA/TolQ/ExbB proton channel family protein [Planctomycetota bacterium]